MEKILSIIVPAYNVEKYIEKCLDSFTGLKAPEEIEVIIVNDGSKDHTEEIAKRYCRNYPKLFSLYTKENGGHGSAINYGMKYVKGRYFRVLDSDDWLDAGELEKFLSFLKDTDADVVASHYKCIQDETYAVLKECRCTRNASLYGKTVAFDDVAKEIELIRIHSFTVKTDVYKKNQIQIDSFRFYVDFEYIMFPVPYIKTVAFYDGALYMYRLGRNGQSVSITSMQKNRENHRKVIDRLLACYDAHEDMSEEKRAYMNMGISKIVENQFQIFISMGIKKGIFKETKQFDMMLKENYPGIYQAVQKKSIWMLRRTGYLILPLAFFIYKIAKR